jgi:hypothetical protein
MTVASKQVSRGMVGLIGKTHGLPPVAWITGQVGAVLPAPVQEYLNSHNVRFNTT